MFALWANFWLLVGFQICGKSEVRRKLNELAPTNGNDGTNGVALSFCVSLFSFRLCLVYLFTCRLFLCFFPAFSLFVFYMTLCFLFRFSLYPQLHIFSPQFARLLYGLVVVNQRARTKIKGPRQICLIANNLWSKRVSVPAHSHSECV